MNETLRGDLNEAKDHAKEAARATLLAMRKGIDLAIEKLGGEDAPATHPGEPSSHEVPAQPATPNAGPEGSITSPPSPDSAPGAGDA